MALERVTTKSKQFHIASLAESYFSFLQEKNWIKANAGLVSVILVAAVPPFIAWLLVEYLPALIVFFLYLVVLWVCLGCPVTRKTYKRYLEAAHREDFQACQLHSMEFGNEGGELTNVGKQLVLVNYRQYASVILFFIFLGIPGVIFYSLVKEWVFFNKRMANVSAQNAATYDEKVHDETAHDKKVHDEQACAVGESAHSSEFNKPVEEDIDIDRAEVEVVQVNQEHTDAAKLLFVLDWIPVRITAFGFLVVGHFSNALSAWFEIMTDASVSAYDALARVSKAAEDVGDCDAHLNEPLQLVKLVKRNIVFILVALSLLTMVGVVA